ncbi:MAG: glycosyltransferase [Hyphomonadaceae bacterium]|nr:glycosyltransferase [Hyphomonadaceae bacterium]
MTSQSFTGGAADRQNLIESLDDWSRRVWREERRSPSVVLAVPIWLAIRIGYRARFVGASFLFFASRPFVWLYWRAYALCGPSARILKRLFWSYAFPILERVAGALNRVYWAAYALCSPAARVLERAYRRSAQSLTRMVLSALAAAKRLWSACYRLFLFPAADFTTRLLGFELAPPQHAKRQTQFARKERAQHTRKELTLTADDAIAWTAKTIEDFDPLFSLVWRLGLARPTPSTLYIFFAQGFAASERHLSLLADKLRSSSPCTAVILCAASADAATHLSQSLRADVKAISGCDVAAFIDAVRSGELNGSPSFEVKAFGPVVLLVTALWGRVGSSAVFDAQTEALIEGGAIVARVFVEHHDRPRHVGDALLREDLAEVRPHLFAVAVRPARSADQRKLRRTEDYKRRSAVRRLELELSLAKPRDPQDADVLAWATRAAQLTVVNHAFHMAFAQRLSAAPVVLETHDVVLQQLESHGWPPFVDLGSEPRAMRDSDQRDLWRRADVCVNLTAADHDAIAPHAKAAFLIAPAAPKANMTLRPWSDVVTANQLSAAFAERETIDVLLWGDWHRANARAVEWFFDRVRPLDDTLQQARIAVIGRVTRLLPDRLRRLHNVVFADFVDELGDFFGRARVLAVADQEASGVSIKALDALRFGRPFVATSVSMRGLDVTGYERVMAATPQALAADLVELLTDNAALRRRAEAAIALYERNVSPDAYRAHWRQAILRAQPSFGDMTVAPSAPPLTGSLEGALWELPPLARKATPAPAVALARAVPVTHPLAAVICTYNRYDVLPGAIESVLQQDIDANDLDIIVVDNSPDQTEAARFAARYAGTRVRYLLEPIPGLSNARNVGALACSARYVAYIDDDAVAASDWARNVVAAFRQFSPKAGVVGGRITPRWIAPRPDWLPDELIGNLSIVDWGGRTRPLGKTEWLAGCNIAFERDTLLALGGFSRALGRVGAGAALLSNEESAVIDRFVDAGRIAIYAPDATVEHLIEPARLQQSWFRRRAAWQAVSDYIKDPEKASAYARAAAERLRQELAQSPEGAPPPGFVQAHTEREAFRRDVGLMYDIVIAMLAGGVELDETGKSQASFQDKLLASVRREMQRNPQLRSTIRKLANI